MVTVDEAPLAEIRRDVFKGPRAFTQLEAPLEDPRVDSAGDRVAPRRLRPRRGCISRSQSSDILATLTSLSAEMPRGSLLAASYGPRARFVVANPLARRATLEVQIEERGAKEIVRYPRFTWMARPNPLDGAVDSAVALLEVT